ncbi:MAG: hypothetical protein DDT34_01404 [Firmicutes bacterium]|nr:hypothetical protein [Bacillota bacterium]
MLSAADVSIPDVLRYFTQRGIEVAFLVPTETGMKKSIMDATSPVRDFLKRAGIHDFDSQPQGQDHKKLVRTTVVTCAGLHRADTSLYRPVTKQGDPRIWISGLKSYASSGNVLALVATSDGELLVINASNAGLIHGVVAPNDGPLLIRDAPCVDLDSILAPLFQRTSTAAEELLALMKGLAGRWHTGLPGEKRHLEVGRLLEELLGIRANSSRSPDYKGIEIKASRGKPGNRQTLFAKVPDWAISPLKSSAQILDAFGYTRDPKYQRQLRCTVTTKAPNTQGLYLRMEGAASQLLEASTRLNLTRVAIWPVLELQATLLAKHPETFWVAAAAKQDGDREQFKYEHVLHTRKPIVSALPTLLETGVITVDHLITRDLKGRVSEQGPLFKIQKKNFDLLFPPGLLHPL